jgi:hypothetical protein
LAIPKPILQRLSIGGMKVEPAPLGKEQWLNPPTGQQPQVLTAGNILWLTPSEVEIGCSYGSGGSTLYLRKENGGWMVVGEEMDHWIGCE